MLLIVFFHYITSSAFLTALSSYVKIELFS
jgi:hypothetical protein